MSGTDTTLPPYAELTDEQKKRIAGTRLGFLIIASGHFDTPEKAIEEMVRTHNEVQKLEDIDKLFETRPDIFGPKITAADVATARPVAVTRPLKLQR